MIRFLLVLLAFVSALLAFMFQETVLFVASGGLLMVSVVLLLLQVREQSKRKNRLKLPNELTPDDELRARGVLEIRPKAKISTPSSEYAPSALSERATQEELRLHGISEVRVKSAELQTKESEPEEIFLEETVAAVPDESALVDESFVEDVVDDVTEEVAAEDSGIPWSLVASESPDEPTLFGQPEATGDSETTLSAETPTFTFDTEAVREDETEEVVSETPIEEPDEAPAQEISFAELVGEALEESSAEALEESSAEALEESSAEALEEVEPEPETVVSGESESETLEPAAAVGDFVAPPFSRRHVEVDAHLPALQVSLGAHTICLIDVDTDTFVYRLRSIVSSGPVHHAGTEYPFAGFFLSDLLAETTVVDVGPGGLTPRDLRFLRDSREIVQVVAAPVMRGGLPAAFLVAGFESPVATSCKQAVTRAADFFSSLYALKVEHPSKGESPLVRAKRKPPSLRLVKSNPKSSQSKIIAEEMTRARGSSFPMAFALVCLDKGDEISRADEMTVYQVEEWMRKCLEQITPEGRIEYLGELGYGIIQLRDVSDVEGWVKRAQQVFRAQHGPVDAHPIVGVAMLSEGHRHPEDLQADAVRALRAAYETGDSTILVG